MKMLVIEVYNKNRSSKDHFKIVSQPFVIEEFYAGEQTFISTNNDGFFLTSRNIPEVRENGLCVRGSMSSHNEKDMVVPSTEWLNKLARAVREYNCFLEDTGGRDKGLSRTMHRKAPNMEFLSALFDIDEVLR